MTTQTTTELAESLIEIIVNSRQLSEEKKDTYLKEIFAGKMPTELSNNWESFVAKEQADMDEEIAELDSYASVSEEAEERAKAEANDAMAEIVAAHAQQTGQIRIECTDEFNRIERNLNNELEGVVRIEKDNVEADAIRSMLKQKPSDTQSA